jgi:hypothetical protein
MDVEITEVGPGVHHARAKHVSWTLVIEGAAVTLVDTGYPRDRERLLRSLELVGRRPSDVEALVLVLVLKSEGSSTACGHLPSTRSAWRVRSGSVPHRSPRRG